MEGKQADTGLVAEELQRFVRAVLAEDIGKGDVTTQVTIPPDMQFEADLVPRQPVVIAGLGVVEAFFRELDPGLSIECFATDGLLVPAGAPVMHIVGPAKAILQAERSVLNTLQHMSGIATMTRQYVDAIEGTGCTLLDTRKTLPGLRAIEKYAARMGGASNHRMRLDDGILIKDNHIATCGGIFEAVKAAKDARTGLEVQVEVDTIEQIEPALSAGADRLLCDNMAPATLREAVRLVGGRVPIEASGGIRLDTIREIATTGVNFISVGRITQSAPAVDIGLDYAAG